MERLDPSAYLRGKEVAVFLAVRTDQDPQGPPAEDAERETVWLRLGAYEVAAIEEAFDGRFAFAQAFEDRPTWTFLRCLAIVLHKPLVDAEFERLGARLFISERAAYAASLEAAWHIAHGLEEEDAGKVWRSRAEVIGGQIPAVRAMHERVLKEIDRKTKPKPQTGSRGKSGSKNGQHLPASASASSGS